MTDQSRAVDIVEPPEASPFAKYAQLGKDQPDEDVFAPNPLSIKQTLTAMAAAFFGGGLMALVAWLVFKQTSLPAFGSSFVTRALATAGIVVTVVAVAIVMYRQSALNRKGETSSRSWAVITYLVGYLSPAALVMASIGIPLSATKLYLDGVAVDQGFRTQYLTHFANTTSLTDMNYADLPAYYPALWFWLGGRFANFMGLEGWEAYQPWALISISAAACLIVPVWQRFTGSIVVATAIALTTTAICLVMTADEPYALIIVLGVPAAVVVGRRGLYGDRFAALGAAVFLGLAACMYTLYTAVIAVSVVVLSAFIGALVFRSFRPVVNVVIIGVVSLAIAATVWAPYILAVLSGEHTSGATATHYLPLEGTLIPMPMFAGSIVGVLCLFGLMYVIVRLPDPDIRGLGIALLVVYSWVVASMMFTIAGQTLLGFRLDVVITVLLATCGLLGIADFRLAGIHRFYPVIFNEATSKAITGIAIVLCAAAGIHYAQDIPNRNAHSINLAYTDTDGFGQRADLYPPDAGQYYDAINQEIQSHGYTPVDTVVLTSEKDFLSYFPYRGFQAITSHYANPLGEFDQRNTAIEQWARYSYEDNASAKGFVERIDSVKWRAPQVFVLYGTLSQNSLDAGWTFDLAEDIYPNNPNVRFRGVKFNPQVFTDEYWHVEEIGPFVVISRV